MISAPLAVFFLAIAVLQFFPKFSTISPGLVILPLLAVLAITAAKDGYEDIKRHQSDHRVNHTITHVLSGGPEPAPAAPGAVAAADAAPPTGYKNYNSMGMKSKTFVPAIRLPHRRTKAEKQAAKREKELAKLRAQGVLLPEDDERAGVTPEPTTRALREGVVDPDEARQEGARPTGGMRGDRTRARGGEDNDDDDDNSSAETVEQQLQRTVTRPDDDPEAFDDEGEVGWKQTIWEDVKVGDFVKIYENEQLPAGACRRGPLGAPRNPS